MVVKILQSSTCVSTDCIDEKYMVGKGGECVEVNGFLLATPLPLNNTHSLPNLRLQPRNFPLKASILLPQPCSLFFTSSHTAIDFLVPLSFPDAAFHFFKFFVEARVKGFVFRVHVTIELV